ncbi:GNAT family N-acetyltransferase [Primorskyibacter sp. S187A]|uniref:GNAT family N-acetyltransferase n=1 Tax=Primorskyibacter sp. S187A TaxID=3415130 RepID=UPI003C7C9C5D
MVETRVLTGAALSNALDDVARLRMIVFHEWPYLYEGDLSYERAYLERYSTSSGAVLVGAFDGARLVGASTGTPLADHADEFQDAAQHLPDPLEDVFYCAESVLLPEFRGRGLGHAFFDAREDHARGLGAQASVFCSVIRPKTHPLRPSVYRPLDGFWRNRGYAPLEGVTIGFSWLDLDKDEEDIKRLQVWYRRL